MHYNYKLDEQAITNITKIWKLRKHENSAMKQRLIIKHNNNTDQITSSDVRKILTNNTIIIYKNNNKKRLQILEAICEKIKSKKLMK